MTFKEALHPRKTGRFIDKENSAPDLVLGTPAGSAFADLRSTLDEMDAELAAQPDLSREQWLYSRQSSQIRERRLFTDALLATDHGYHGVTASGGRGIWIDGQNSDADALFDLQAERSLAYAADYKARFTDKEEAAARQRVENLAQLAAVKRQSKIDSLNDAVAKGYITSVFARKLVEVSNPENTAEQLAEHASIDRDEIVDEVIEHPNVSTDTLAKLSTRTPVAALYAARRDDCPVSLLVELSVSKVDNIRTAVAKHPQTPTATLRAMSKDDDRDVLAALAGNPASGRGTLKRLADGSGSAASVAAHRRLLDLDAK